MRLVISSQWFPVSIAGYLERAARRAGHDVLTVGPWRPRMPWTDARPDQDYSAFGPPKGHLLVTEGEDGRATLHGDVQTIRDHDLWIDVDGGWFAVEVLPGSPEKRVLVATDPHVPGDHWTYETQRAHVRRVYMMQLDQVDVSRGDVWLPYAYDPEWHRPVPVEEDYAATNLGACYDERCEISDVLHAKGLLVLGPGRGPIGKEYSKQLCRAPVALVWPLAKDLPARVFEAVACGRIVFMPEVSGFDQLFCKPLAWSVHPCTPREFAETLVFTLLADRKLRPPERRYLGSEKHREWLAANSWDARLEFILQTEAESC